MDTYTFLREFADSWVLLAMFGFFVLVIVFAFRSGSTDTYKAVADIPLRDDAGPERAAPEGCAPREGADHV